MTDDIRFQFPSVDESLDYAKLSIIVYEANKKDESNELNMLSFQQLPITCHHFEEIKDTDTQVMIVSCDYNKKTTTTTDTTTNIDGYIAVVYRGTEKNMKDFVTDIKCALTPFNLPSFGDKNGKVHTGFHKAFIGNGLHDLITKELDDLCVIKPNHKIVFTGHSLGAALSILAALYTACRLPTRNILNIHFGSPRVGNNDFKSFVEEKVINCAIWRCVYEDDIVTTLPPTPFLGYQHIGHLIQLDRKAGGLAYSFRNDDHVGPNHFALSVATQLASDNVPDSVSESKDECEKIIKEYLAILHQHDLVNLSGKMDIAMLHQQDHVHLSGKMDIIPKPFKDHDIANYIEYLKQKDKKYFPKVFRNVGAHQPHPVAKLNRSSSDNEESTPSPKRVKL